MDVVRDALIAGFSALSPPLPVSLPDRAVEHQQKPAHFQADLGLPAEALGVHLLQQREQLAAQGVEFQGIHGIDIVLLRSDPVHEIEIIRRFLPQPPAEILAEPEHKAAIGPLLASDHGPVDRVRREDQHVPRPQGMASPGDLHLYLALAEEIELRIDMAVGTHRGKVLVAVIIDLKIL